MNDPTTVGALRDAIQSDMRSRLDELSARLEFEVERAQRVEDVEQLLAQAFTEATHLFAAGFAARVRESRLASD